VGTFVETVYLRTRPFGLDARDNKSSSKVFGSFCPTLFWPSRRTTLCSSFW